MAKAAFTTFLVFAILYIGTVLAYGIVNVVADLQPPEGASPARFLGSVLVSKVGVAIAFVLIFYLARSSLSRQWFLYAVLWWLMFVAGEVGQAIGPNYSWKEDIAGIISETIYVPLSAHLSNW